jgi:hypothetical protein
MQNDLIQRARRYATEVHERISQRRKYTLAPYDVHLKAVADLVASVTSDPEMIAAAWLHDTVEDTPTTFEDLEREFGREVMLLVMELTDVSAPSDGNRAVRKELDRRHLTGSSPRAKTIKLADLIDNTGDIAKHDPRFSRVYLPEMASLLEVLTEGDPALLRKAAKTVADCSRKLGLSSPHSEVTGAATEDPEKFDVAISQFRGLNLFTESFTSRNIFEPLRSFDQGITRKQLRDTFNDSQVSVVGIRQCGHITHYLLDEDLTAERPRLQPRSFETLQMAKLETPLADIIHSLNYHSHCFVELEGEVIGVISRSDLDKPAARMWLFGLIMLIEISTTNIIRDTWKNNEWRLLITGARLAKAEELQQERKRRKLPSSLLDCLQFSDKLQILSRKKNFIKESAFSSVSAAKHSFKGLESLRNNLAHGQDIANADWPSIVRLARLLCVISESHSHPEQS